MSKHDDEKSRVGCGPAGAAAAIIALPFLYVALLGPAARIHNSSPRPIQAVIETVYAPLEWLDQRLPGQPLEKYADLWSQ